MKFALTAPLKTAFVKVVSRSKTGQRQSRYMQEYLHSSYDNLEQMYGDLHAELGRLHTRQGDYARLSPAEYSEQDHVLQGLIANTMGDITKVGQQLRAA